MNLLAYICWLRDSGFIWGNSRERPGNRLSNSEIRRWIASGGVVVNGERQRDPLAAVTFPVSQLVLFPSGRLQTTLI